jgi:hypothetical protein
MKLIYNIQTDEIMHDRQSSDNKAEKQMIAIQEKLKEYRDISKMDVNLSDKLSELLLQKHDIEIQIEQETSPQQRRALWTQHASFNTQEGKFRSYLNLKEQEVNARRKSQEYIDKRINAIIRMYGGIREDYKLIDVPDEDMQKVFQARYIRYENGELKYDEGPLFEIIDKSIQINPGWVRGNERIIYTDITDFSDLGNTEPLDFKFCFYRINSTQGIIIKGFWKKFDESWGPEPEGHTFVSEICRGIITESQEIQL